MVRPVILGLLAAATACLPPRLGAEELAYLAVLNGASQLPANGSAGSGTAIVRIDLTLSLLHVEVDYSGLAGAVATAHIQGFTPFPGLGLAGSITTEPTLSGFVSGATSGFYHGVLDLNSPGTYNSAFLEANGGSTAAALNALAGGLAAGQTYFNIKTSSFPNGEIRGFLATSPSSDLDLNGRVDRVDFRLWLLVFGEQTNFGDMDDDGDSDGADFLTWQRQFGQVAEIPPHHHGLVATVAVPEPSGWALAAAGWGALGVRRGWRAGMRSAARRG